MEVELFVLPQLMDAIRNCESRHICMALVVFVVCHHFLHRKDKGPLSWPLVGMLPSLLWNINHVYDWATRMLVECGGTLVFRGLWNTTSLYSVFTCDPRNIDYILKTNFANFSKGDQFRNICADVFGEGILTRDGEEWARQRKHGSVLLNAAAFRNDAAEWINHLIYNRLLPILQDASGSTVDFQDILLRFAFDNTCKTSMGIDSCCLFPNLPSVPIAEAFDEATLAPAYRYVLPQFWWKTMRLFGLGREAKVHYARKTFDEFVYRVIADRKKELSCHGGIRVDSGRCDLLSGLLQLVDENGSLYSDKACRDFIVSFFLAGRDTTPVALSWFFWLLHNHPLVEQEIYSELLEILKKRPGTANDLVNPAPFTMDEIRQMKYLHASLSESMRLYPPVAFLPKEATRDDILPDGTALSKGSKINSLVYSTGRMESVWGEDCCEFKPGRWLKDGEFVSEKSGRYAVFNPGPRLCLGKDLAYVQMKMVAAAIIWRFRVRVVEGHPVVPRLGMTLFMKHGLLATLPSR